MISLLRRLMGGTRGRMKLAALAISLLAILGAFRLTARGPSVPTAEVKRDEFVDALKFRGEVKALKTLQIVAPPQAGDLQILKLAQDGISVKKGDIVVEFDKTKTVQDLAQFKSALSSANAEIAQTRAQGSLVEQESLTAVEKARYDFEVAKLEASKQEIVSRIEGEEAKLALADAEQKLREAKKKLASDRSSNTSKTRNKQQASEKNRYDAQTAEKALAAMTLRAPGNGTLILDAFWHNGGNMVAPAKAGERVWPGTLLAEIPDLSTLRVTGRIDENERGRVLQGLPVSQQFDAIPDRKFTGRITQIGTLASTDFSSGWPFPRNFIVEITLDQADPRLRPGMSADVRVTLDRVADAIVIPTEAVFQKGVQTKAFVAHGSSFEERTIQVGRKSGDRALVTSGLKPGERIALQDPTGKE